uniref:HTH arsR-type domain-containing protein n=1 Tax=Rhodococcus sp. NS1 TaxID=402236 RepID=A0A097SQ15_9NOCA|nr:hypothetical protein LRS1606.189 [Rhodococcus sp. NS1]
MTRPGRWGGRSSHGVGSERSGAPPARIDNSGCSEYRNRCTVGFMETLIQRDALARFGYALSDTTRTQILLNLRSGPGYPSELAEQIGVSRQILSNHLACLRGCGLVVAIPEGRRNRYELADPRIGRALDDLVGLVLAVDPACCPDAADDGCC